MKDLSKFTQKNNQKLEKNIHRFNLAALLDKALQMTPTGPRAGLAPRSKLEFYAALEGDDVPASKFVQEMADATAAEAPLAGVPEIHPVLKLAETVVALRVADCKVRQHRSTASPLPRA